MLIVLYPYRINYNATDKVERLINMSRREKEIKCVGHERLAKKKTQGKSSPWIRRIHAWQKNGIVS